MKFGRLTASPSENNFRLNTFYKNYMKIVQVNNADLKWKAGLNKFSDMTEEEFRAKYLGFNPNMVKAMTKGKKLQAQRQLTETPVSLDWRKKGAVGPIRNQGQCGSCWAFASSFTVGAQYFIKSGNLVDISAQQLIDCSGSHGNHGCNGGWMTYAFEYFQDQGPNNSSDYPYTARTGTCKWSSDKVVTTVSSYRELPTNDEKAIEAELVNGPVATAIDSFGIQSYASGIYTGDCGTSINHGMIFIGYDNTDPDNKYWILRNMWGSDWGEDGYIRIEKDIANSSGKCGLAISPATARVQ